MTGCPPKAILLDLDDTILSDNACAAGCWETVCAQYAPRAGCAPERLREAVRRHAAWYWGDPERHRRGRLDLAAGRAEMVASALKRLGRDDPALAWEMAAAYGEAKVQHIRPFPGALETLARLRERGARLALLTNGGEASQRAKIEKFALAGYFDCIVIEGAFGCGKPDARVYRHALDSLESAPGEAWMVGDNLEWDVSAPQRLGIFGIWHDYAGTGLPPGCLVRPDRIIRSLAELLGKDEP